MLLLDNHDSFTYNLVELLRGTGKCTVKIVTPEDFIISDLHQAERVIFSPGPGLPQEQPRMFEILAETERMAVEEGRRIPILGVCLGLQAIALHFGGTLCHLPKVVHGQPRPLHILRPEHPLFAGIDEGTPVGLYHSWAADPATLPACLTPLAATPDGTLMALAHNTLPVWGVQFHPESIMTPAGRLIINNFLDIHR